MTIFTPYFWLLELNTPFFAGVVVKPLYANYLRSEWLVSLPVK